MSVATYESRGVRWLRYALIGIITLVAVFPILWIIASSLKPTEALFTTPPQILPNQITLEHYAAVFSTDLFLMWFLNSLVVATVTTILSVVLAVLAGFGWGKYEFMGSRSTSLFVIMCRTFPVVVIIVPLFQLLRQIGLINTRPGLILAYFVYTLPLTAWMLKGFFENIPDNVIRAARIDGLSEIQIFYEIALPLVKPGIAATAIFSFVIMWQELLYALTFMQSKGMKTLPVVLYEQMNLYTIEWGYLMALSVVFVLPVTILFLLTQKYFIRGIVGGTV